VVRFKKGPHIIGVARDSLPVKFEWVGGDRTKKKKILRTGESSKECHDKIRLKRKGVGKGGGHLSVK